MPKEGVLIDLQRKQQEKGFKEALQKIKDLEQALAKEQAEHAETKERAKSLKIILEMPTNRNEDLTKQTELLRKLLKSLL